MTIHALAGVGLAALVAAALPAPVHAATDDPAPVAAAPAEDGTPIIVTARTAADTAETNTRRTPGGADVVRHEDYADRSLVSLRDALAYAPGVYLQPRYGQEVRLSVRGSGLSRGFHMRGLTLLQDGVPINLADDNGDFQELEPTFFDHLVVHRGANALRLGSGTLGGAINGVTPTGRGARGLYTRLDVGSFDSVRALVSAGLADDRGDAWGAISIDRSDGDRDHARRRSLRAHGNVGVALGDRVDTRFYASVNAIDQELPGALTFDDALTSPRRGNFIGDQARDITSIRVQNRTTLRLGGDARLEGGVFANAKSLYHPIFQVVDQESLDRGAYARLDMGADGPWSLTVGGELRYGTTTARRFINVDGRRGAPTFLADWRARTASVYAEARWRPAEPLTLIAGGLFASGWREQHERFNSFAGGARDVLARARFEEVSPRFGALWEVAPSVQLFANYSRSAEFPGFIELGQVATFVPLDAQTAWTAEVGARGGGGGLDWEVSAYRAALRGELLQFTVGPDIPASTFNADRTIHQGIEAGLTVPLHRLARLRGTWTWSDFRFDGDRQYGDNRLPVIPPHVVRAELRIGTERMHVSPAIEWLPRGAFADYANTTRTPGYALLGATAALAIGDDVSLFLDARNLTGRRAIGDISAVVTATPASVIYQPVERRALFGGVRARW